MMKMKGLVIVVLVVAAVLVGWKTGIFANAETAPQMLTQSMKMQGSVDHVVKNFSVTMTDKSEGKSKELGSLTLVVGTNQAETVADTTAQVTFDGTFKDDEGGPFSTITIGGEFLMMGKIFYMKLTKLPMIPIFDPSQVKDQWFKIDPIALTRSFGGEEEADEMEKQLDLMGAQSKENQEAIAAAYDKHNFFTNPAFTGTEDVGGHKVKMISFGIDKDKLADFIVDIATAVSKDDADVEVPTKAEIVDLLANVNFSNLTVGIGTADHRVYKMAGTINVTDVEADMALDVAMTGTMDYDTPVVVTAPAKSEPIEKLLAPMLGAMMGGGM